MTINYREIHKFKIQFNQLEESFEELAHSNMGVSPKDFFSK
jgi:hypothetical protein